MTILEEIIRNKRQELTELKEKVPIRNLEGRIAFNTDTVSLIKCLLDKTRTGIIAEFKRRSPSSGILNLSSSVEEVTSGYYSKGASGVSILTDNKFFGGSATDLTNARAGNSFPILRKDFIIDEYQVIESKSIGADVILLIASVLDKDELQRLAGLSRSLGMEVLLEVHDSEELEKINQYVNIIGVNNRNLKSFSVDTGVSVKIAPEIPEGFLKISESGISSTSVIEELRYHGYDGFLIGGQFMRSSDPVSAFSEFVNDLNHNYAKS